MTDTPEDPLARARFAGRREGERFDAALREREREDLDGLLIRRPPSAEDDERAGPPAGEVPSSEVWRLRRRVEELAAFHDALTRSRAWRLIQALRRPLGRAW